MDEFEQLYRRYYKDVYLYLSTLTGDRSVNEFIFIIDEWDALFREAKDDDALQKEYIRFLRGLFKGGTATDETIAAAYMTGKKSK